MTDLVSFAKKAGSFAAIGGAGYVLPVGVVVVVLETLLPWSRTGHRNSEKPSGTTEP